MRAFASAVLKRWLPFTAALQDIDAIFSITSVFIFAYILTPCLYMYPLHYEIHVIAEKSVNAERFYV